MYLLDIVRLDTVDLTGYAVVDYDLLPEETHKKLAPFRAASDIVVLRIPRVERPLWNKIQHALQGGVEHVWVQRREGEHLPGRYLSRTMLVSEIYSDNYLTRDYYERAFALRRTTSALTEGDCWYQDAPTYQTVLRDRLALIKKHWTIEERTQAANEQYAHYVVNSANAVAVAGRTPLILGWTETPPNGLLPGVLYLHASAPLEQLRSRLHQLRDARVTDCCLLHKVDHEMRPVERDNSFGHDPAEWNALWRWPNLID